MLYVILHMSHAPHAPTQSTAGIDVGTGVGVMVLVGPGVGRAVGIGVGGDVGCAVHFGPSPTAQRTGTSYT